MSETMNQIFGPLLKSIETILQSKIETILQSNDWPYITAGILFLFFAITQCVVKLLTSIKDYGYSRQKRRIERSSFLSEAAKKQPGILLEAEINAEKFKLNEHDAWCRWRQEKEETYHDTMVELKPNRRSFSWRFASLYVVFQMVLWSILPLLKMLGLFSRKNSGLNNIKFGEMIFPAIIIGAIIWIIAYAIAYHLYGVVRESNNPIAIWGFSWMSPFLLFTAIIAIRVEDITEHTSRFFLAELVVIIILFILLGFAIGHGLDYAIDRFMFSNRTYKEEHYHIPLCTSLVHYWPAISNLLFWMILSILFELLYAFSYITNMENVAFVAFVVFFLFIIVLSFAAFIFGVILPLAFIYFILREEDFALHGYQVNFHENHGVNDKFSRKIISYGLLLKDKYLSRPIREGYSFDGWNTQADGSGKTVKDKDRLSEIFPKECGQHVDLYAQWKKSSLNALPLPNGNLR